MSGDDRKDGPGKPSPSDEPASNSAGDEAAGRQRRQAERVDTTLRVDYRNEGTFLFAYATNVSSLGIFIHTRAPESPGTKLELQFGPGEEGLLCVRGEVVWTNPYRPGGSNPNPGMGIRFIELDAESRQRLVLLVRRIAYLEDAIRGTA